MNNHHTHLMGDIRAILMATDCSSYSEGAIQEAIYFAQACRVKLNVLHTLQDNPELMAHSQSQDEEHACARYLDNVRTMAKNEDIECEVIVKRWQHGGEAIVKVAEDTQSDLIIMGRRGLSGLKKIFMGNNTAKVLSQATCKVLVVPKDSMNKGENILLSYDGSKESMAAADELISMGVRCPHLKKIVVLSVTGDTINEKTAQANNEEVINRLKEAGVKAELVGCVEKSSSYPDGVVKAILDTCKKENIDMLLIGKYGRRKSMRKMFIGSVTENVVNKSPIAVLTVKA
jgi:hypothetical protein